MRNKRYGIQIDDSGDLVVADGGLSMGDTLAQNEFLLLVSGPGDLKESPLMGAGISDMVGDHDMTGWKRRIIDALKDDGLRVRSLELATDGTLTRLEADY